MNPFGSLSAMYSFKTSSSLWGIPHRGPSLVLRRWSGRKVDGEAILGLCLSRRCRGTRESVSGLRNGILIFTSESQGGVHVSDRRKEDRRISPLVEVEQGC